MVYLVFAGVGRLEQKYQNKNNGVVVSSSLNSLSTFSLWSRCSDYLHEELPVQQFNTWIKPLAVEGLDVDLSALNDPILALSAPNRFVKNWVAHKFQSRLSELARLLSGGVVQGVSLTVEGAASFDGGNNKIEQASPGGVAPHTGDHHMFGAKPVYGAEDKTADLAAASRHSEPAALEEELTPKISFGADRQSVSGNFNSRGATLETDRWATGREPAPPQIGERYEPVAVKQNFLDKREITNKRTAGHQNNVLDRYRFDNFVGGKSNQMALAAAKQVVENPSTSYNPLFLYGGVGLGKTHLMHAVGNEIKRRKPNAKVVYLHSERFVGDMVKALQLNAIDDFKRYYRSVDALLIDDIQFFAGKDRSQEEFFHTFNALLEGGYQMIFSCDRYPKSINGIEERLKSRFGWGLTVQIEPPELEMRVAILKRKAEQEGIDIPNDAAFFLAQRVRANGRDLEGALKRVYANSQFQDTPITVELVKESLRDLLALQDKLVTIGNIQKTAAEYYKIKLSDLLSKRRNRSLARPRQVAMALAKELTRHSLPEIGDSFGGRDHTTVLHACRKVKELRESSHDVSEDYRNLVRLLST